MFTGYKQQQAFIYEVLDAVEDFMYKEQQKDKALDNLELWELTDLRRLISAFLGTRFPMTLALNKSDVPSAADFISNIQSQLPIHGAHSGVGLCAHKEMLFVRNCMPMLEEDCYDRSSGTKPIGVWDTLCSAFRLRSPVLVFPVIDLITYKPLPGMLESASRNASLPNPAMIECLKNSGGMKPSMWDEENKQYCPRIKETYSLRDVIVMKHGSTVEDVFLHLKNIGALGGEFVRAEAAGKIGEKGKPIPKTTLLSKHVRILKIMTNKRKSWQ